MTDTQVVVAGAGPVGLAAALALGRLGVATLVVERRPGLSVHPRARGLTARTMEIFRAWGVADAVRARSLPAEAARHVHVGSSLTDPHLRRVVVADDLGHLSPCEPAVCSQTLVEPVLRDAAVATGHCQLVFGTELVGFDEGPDGLVLSLDGGAAGRRTARCEYLIAADGCRSGVRDALGIRFPGVNDLARHVSFVIDADLDDLEGPLRCRFVSVTNPAIRGMVGASGVPGRYLVMAAHEPCTTAAGYTELAARLVPAALGVDRPFRLVDASSWSAGGQVAGAFRRGRVFLAGDAAHVTSPAGGFGMNTGFADVHNLAWKLAAVLGGSAAPRLLDSYDVERRPVAQQTVDHSLYTLLTRVALTSPAARRDVATGLQLGSSYEKGAFVPDGSVAEGVADPVREYRPQARPGHRAPHAWTAAGRSTLDLVGDDRFALITTAGGGWLGRVGIAGLAVHAARLGLARQYGVHGGGAVLVRPDGIVGWRRHTPVAIDTAVKVALATVLHGGPNTDCCDRGQEA